MSSFFNSMVVCDRYGMYNKSNPRYSQCDIPRYNYFRVGHWSNRNEPQKKEKNCQHTPAWIRRRSVPFLGAHVNYTPIGAIKLNPGNRKKNVTEWDSLKRLKRDRRQEYTMRKDVWMLHKFLGNPCRLQRIVIEEEREKIIVLQNNRTFVLSAKFVWTRESAEASQSVNNKKYLKLLLVKEAGRPWVSVFLVFIR